MKRILALTILLSSGLLGKANVRPNTLFTNNGVLQQGVVVPVWGTANNNEQVTVEFAGQIVSTTASNGKWMIKLQPLKASNTPLTMTIKGENTVTINNILVGEVWLCSGQSNMGFPVRSVRALPPYAKVEEVIKDAQNYPLLRQYTIPLIKSTTTPGILNDANGKWLVCDSTNVKNFSAVAYFFARDLFKKLNTPIGIVNSSYGGTAIENWVSKETLETFPELKSIFTNYEKALGEFPKKLEEYQKNEKYLLEAYSRDSADAKKYGKEMPRKPAPPMSPAERGGPTGLWNTMIYPLIPYAFKGCVWYQGEANASRGIQYRTLLPALMNSWRATWNMGDFQFIVIQIPGWKNHSPELREAQLLTTQKIKNSSMVVITDCDDTLDVHPGNKEPVGMRAALQAKALVYGEKKTEYLGPVYENMKVEGNKIILTFSHCNGGLEAKGGELKDFIIAGADKKFIPAKAVIEKNKVIVSADGIDKPTAVRLGWRLAPQINLYNKDGLVASAFRTDVE
jgi:sialate O-acetylesterase